MDNILKAYQTARNCADKSSLCHAPTYLMHLAQNGHVLVCSNSRQNPIGKYPDESLHQIWFGKKAKLRRKQMKETSFPYGCEFCKISYDTKQFVNMRSSNYEHYALTSTSKIKRKLINKIYYNEFAEYPSEINFELSNTCNLECVMCVGLISSSIRENREKLPPIKQHYDQKIIDELREFIPHLKAAKFFGGEPFLIPLYIEIFELITELNPNCNIVITTNGTVLNNRIRNIISKLNNIELVISLDAVEKSTFEKIRVNANFERVMENVSTFNNLLKAKRNKIHISPTFSKLNHSNYPFILDFANENKIYFQCNFLISPSELSLSSLPSSQIQIILEKWKSHPPKPSSDKKLEEENYINYSKAISKVEAWLNEQIEFEATTYGKILQEILPENKFDLTFNKLLSKKYRFTNDIAIEMQLSELYKNEIFNFNIFSFLLEKYCVELFKLEPSDAQKVNLFIKNLKDNIESQYNRSAINNAISNLLNDFELWHILDLIMTFNEIEFMKSYTAASNYTNKNTIESLLY